MINRKEYLDELIRWKDKDLIKVVTGIRRCGKSTLFELYIDYLKNEGVKSHQIIHINLEDADYDFKDYKELYRFVNKKINIDEKFYVFLDEVQNVPEFQKAVDSLYIKKNIDVYITGSNAYLLSGELREGTGIFFVGYSNKRGFEVKYDNKQKGNGIVYMDHKIIENI